MTSGGCLVQAGSPAIHPSREAGRQAGRQAGVISAPSSPSGAYFVSAREAAEGGGITRTARVFRIERRSVRTGKEPYSNEVGNILGNV